MAKADGVELGVVGMWWKGERETREDETVQVRVEGSGEWQLSALYESWSRIVSLPSCSIDIVRQRASATPKSIFPSSVR